MSLRRDVQEEFDRVMKGKQRESGERSAFSLLLQTLRV
jgi:hypothetical protein